VRKIAASRGPERKIRHAREVDLGRAGLFGILRNLARKCFGTEIPAFSKKLFGYVHLGSMEQKTSVVTL
jgi:hypothetical protein